MDADINNERALLSLIDAIPKGTTDDFLNVFTHLRVLDKKTGSESQ